MTKILQQPIQAYTTTYDRLVRRIVTPLEVSVAFDPAHPPAVPPPAVRVNALWDTGATHSSISTAVKDTLGLSPTGATRVNHAGGQSTHTTFIVNLNFPNLRFIGVPVTELPALPPEIGFLVGMDIIGTGDFAVTNVGGTTKMSFRNPSTEAIDFVRDVNESRKAALARVGRNDPCPCGAKGPTGNPVKFKKCHGAARGA